LKATHTITFWPDKLNFETTASKSIPNAFQMLFTKKKDVLTNRRQQRSRSCGTGTTKGMPTISMDVRSFPQVTASSTACGTGPITAWVTTAVTTSGKYLNKQSFGNIEQWF